MQHVCVLLYLCKLLNNHFLFLGLYYPLSFHNCPLNQTNHKYSVDNAVTSSKSISRSKFRVLFTTFEKLSLDWNRSFLPIESYVKVPIARTSPRQDVCFHQERNREGLRLKQWKELVWIRDWNSPHSWIPSCSENLKDKHTHHDTESSEQTCKCTQDEDTSSYDRADGGPHWRLLSSTWRWREKMLRTFFPAAK